MIHHVSKARRHHPYGPGGGRRIEGGGWGGGWRWGRLGGWGEDVGVEGGGYKVRGLSRGTGV